jgi:dihydroorotate dehydrogenase/Pyruvate/2-oxoacid:ferredoxin oxidoreductase delta subunit
MTDETDISVRLGSLTLRNPFIVGSGPTTRSLEKIKEAEDAGWAAASLKLTIDPEPYLSLPPRYRWLGKSRMHIFTAEKRLAPGAGLRLMEQARRATKDIAVFANISYDGADTEGWSRLARRFEEAGAHAIELNMCCPNMSFNVSTTGERTVKATGASLGSEVASLPTVVRAVRDSVKIPVIAKLTPEGGRIAEAAFACLGAGADAVGSTANRLGIPEIDIRDPMASIYRLQDNITLGCLSGPWIRPLAMRDTYEMRRLLGEAPFVIGSGGVSDLPSAVQQIMVGADALWVCAETILRGFGWIGRLLTDLRAYMAEMGWSRIRDFRGLLMRNIKSAGELVIHEGHAVVNPALCTGCGRCWTLGHCTAITHPDGKALIDAERCLGCSTCVDVCLKDALSMTRT